MLKKRENLADVTWPLKLIMQAPKPEPMAKTECSTGRDREARAGLEMSSGWLAEQRRIGGVA